MQGNETDCTDVITFTSDDYTFLGLSAALFLSYNLSYAWKVWFAPHKTNIGFNLESRKAWISKCMDHEPGRMLGIQAVRNAGMSASFFATTSLTIAFFVAQDALRNCGIHQIQELVLAAALFWAFIHWVISTEIFNHLSFLLSAEDYTVEPAEHITRGRRIVVAQKAMVSATLHFSLGIRVFYLSFCITGWILHPIICLLVTLASVWYLFSSDYSFYTYDDGTVFELRDVKSPSKLRNYDHREFQ